jgi:lysophospholipase L1-like esterase
MSSHFLVRLWSLFSALSGVCLVANPPACVAEIALKNGDKIVFLGDSITANGAASPSGFVRLVISGLESNGNKTTAIPAGIIGNKSNDLLARLDRDVIAKKPSWLALSCGLNDVWLGGRGIALEPFRDNVTAIVERTQAAGIKVLILTSTMIGEDPANPHNQKAVAYNEILRSIAADKKCLLADLNAEMRSSLETASYSGRGDNQLTTDGVHMNPMGDQMMAVGILKAFGLDEAQLEKARQKWLDQPNSCDLALSLTVSLRDYLRLREVATKQGRSVDQLINEAGTKALRSLLGTNPESGTR